MIERYASIIIRWRWAVIALTIIAVMFVASGGRNLGFTTDYRAFFSSDNPQLLAFEELQSTYDRADNVIFVITPKDGDVFTEQTLTSIKWLTDQAWEIPFAMRVDSITNFQHTSVSGDDLLVRDLVPDPAAFTAEDFERVRAVAINEPILIDRAINANSTVTGVNVTIHLPGESRSEVTEVAEYARELGARLQERDPSLEVGLTGMVMFNNAFAENTIADLTSLIPMMFLVVIVGLGLLFRNISATFSTTLMIFFSIMMGVGTFGWFGYNLTPPSASGPIIIMTIAVADAVHLLLSMLTTMRAGLSKHEAIIESLRANMRPIFLTSLTTTIGFLALNASEVPPIVHLGNIVAVGVVGAFLLSITFLPALVAVLPMSVKQSKTQPKTLAHSFSEMIIKSRGKILLATAVLSLAFISFIPRNEINDDFVKYFDESTDFRVDTDYAIEQLIGPNNIQYSLKSQEGAGVSDPEFLQQVQAFVSYLKTQQEVKHVDSITDTMKRLNMNMHGDEDEWYRLPEEKNLASQYLLLYELSLPFGLDLSNQINLDKTATRVSVTFGSVTTKQMLELENRIGLWIAQNVTAFEYEASSSNLVFAHIGQRNTRGMIGSAVLALVLISFILVAALKSVKIGLLSLIPNVLPIGIAFGLWGIFIGEVGLSLAPVVGITLGIIVDDTIHFLSKYLHARREKGVSAEESIEYAFQHVGSALMITTTVLFAGFTVLTLSPFKLNSDMGLLTVMTIVIALLVDFLLLPALLLFLDRKEYVNAS